MHRDLFCACTSSIYFYHAIFQCTSKVPSTNMSFMNKLVYVELHKMTETYTCVNKICSFLYAINLK